MTLEEIKQTSPFAMGGENVDYAQYFDGTSYLNMLSLKQVVVGNVTFEPACRNHWHIHHASQGGGQMLLVTAGRGWYQEWGKPAQVSTPAMSSISRPTSSIGTALPRTVPSSIWPLKSTGPIRVRSGVKP